jgi:prophage regulatory protein
MTFLRIGDVRRLTGLSKSEVYRRARDGIFPKPHRLSHRVSVWIESDVRDWMNNAACRL